MKNGDCVFFKTAKVGVARTSAEAKFSGHGFGVLLGQVPPFQKPPTKVMIYQLLGAIGFLTFDDVGEFLGEEKGAEVLRKFQQKYYNLQHPETSDAEPPKPQDLTREGLSEVPVNSIGPETPQP